MLLVVKIKLISNGKSRVYRTRTTLRRALRLPEILLDIEKVNDTLIFRGRGWGHGVGYSQWGSAELGKRGASYREILNFYYNSTKIKKLW